MPHSHCGHFQLLVELTSDRGGAVKIKEKRGSRLEELLLLALAFSIVANECHKLIRLLRYAAFDVDVDCSVAFT